MIRPTIAIRTLISTVYEDHYVPERLLESPGVTHLENRRAIKHFGEFLYGAGGDATIDDLSKDSLIAFREWRIRLGARKGKAGGKPKTVSPATINKEVRILRAIEQFVYDEFSDQLGLMVPRRLRKLKEPKRKPEAYPVEAITQVLQSASRETGQIAGVPAGKWWVSQLAAFYDTGLRRKALLSSTWADLDVDRRFLRVAAEEQKDDEEQYKELHPDTLKSIQAIRFPARLAIWPYPYATHNPWYDSLHRILDRAELSRLPRLPAHAFRASHATYLSAAAGLQAAADSCGHSSSQVTKDHYIDNRLLSAGRTASQLQRPTMPSDDRQQLLF
jgi:integrase